MRVSQNYLIVWHFKSKHFIEGGVWLKEIIGGFIIQIENKIVKDVNDVTVFNKKVIFIEVVNFIRKKELRENFIKGRRDAYLKDYFISVDFFFEIKEKMLIISFLKDVNLLSMELLLSVKDR